MNTTRPPEQTCTNCQTCGTCAEWSRCTDARMANHGECEYRGVGHYSHELSPCLLTPSCWRKNAK